MNVARPLPRRLPEGTIHSESLFVDSGAHALYNLFVLQYRNRKGGHGRDLDRPNVRWGQGDFSYYSLKKGSDFREYCDAYAAFMRKMGDRVLLANVDVISHPDLTWEVQRYFEEEHGIQPVPIVHYGASMRQVDRYVEATVRREGKTVPKYDLLGVGGLGQGITRDVYVAWGDRFFSHICPEKNGYLPLIKTHGFAMTAWELMCRWPWWSVDSATWVKLSAYGWLLVPPWSDEKGWRYDLPPRSVNVSRKETDRKWKFWWRVGMKGPRQSKDRHYDNTSHFVREAVDRWIAYLGLEFGAFDREGNIAQEGVCSHHRIRSIANLHYLKSLEESRPPWPHPLDHKLVDRRKVRHSVGLGF